MEASLFARSESCVAAIVLYLTLAWFGKASSAALDPTPDPAAVVTSGQARFTVLTEHIIRMQFGQDHDEPTFTFLNRRMSVPDFSKAMHGDWLEINTTAVHLRYLTTSTQETFNEHNLQVDVLSTSRTWMPIPTFNITLQGNLLGTARTLDHNTGASSMDLNCLTNKVADLHCTLAVISQWGYVVIDDTGRPRFDHDPDWPWLDQPGIPAPTADQCDIANTSRRDCGYVGIREIDCVGKGCCYHARHHRTGENGVPSCFYARNAQQDLYFFGHGLNYTLALKEFTDLAGKIPMPPRFAFGLIYSRYWAYSDFGEMEIVNQFRDHSLPLDAVVSDMDWHITFYDNVKDQAGERRGWTGFTWDKHLFPDPSGYLKWCKARGLKNTLNLHPASGVQPWEDHYKEMATAMGVDPTTNIYVPFVPENKTFVTNWNKIVLGAREEEGIDFWWLDWQQGEGWINITGVNPTFWLNYIFYTNPNHWNGTAGIDQRGMLLHRFGGLGNHRYQVGFSGDVLPSWDSLHFQVYFTITASNVGFGYWSHDLGGHVGVSPPELYTRWIQFGTFSPIFRIHAKKDSTMWRRPWLYPPRNYDILMKFFFLRASLVPYIYTAAREAYESGVSLMRPMYYSYPDNPLSYQYDHQYMFGDSILVAPVTVAMDPQYNTSRKAVFLPLGLTLVNWQSGEVFHGQHQEEEVTRNYTLSETPVFVKAGTIIPMTPSSEMTLGSAKQLPLRLSLLAFVAGGAAMAGRGQVYEDDGATNSYKATDFSQTAFSYTVQTETSTANTVQFTVGAMSGSFPEMLTERSYNIILRGTWPASDITLNGKALSEVQFDTGCHDTTGCFSYDGSQLAVVITTSSLPVNVTHTVVASLTAAMPSAMLQTDFTGRLARLAEAKQLLDDQWGIHTVHQQQYYSLLLAAHAGIRITYSPATAHAELAGFEQLVTAARSEVTALSLADSGYLKSTVLELLS
ncbi:oligosaccharide 4-alpha-D-glucosyltransferase-like [Sycon ciliatum]|uniref:oligosaccharide 4-alpha-D-glucosyltransferase-like n=1 Tax=Sycon ciliatum TaxID=27933 RepID=UPI0031F65FCE